MSTMIEQPISPSRVGVSRASVVSFLLIGIVALWPATASGEIPPFCEVLLDPAIGTVAARTNDTADCELPTGAGSESAQCAERVALDFEVTLSQTLSSSTLVLRCSVENPATTSVGANDDERSASCRPSEPGGPLAQIWHVEHTLFGTTVIDDAGVVASGWQQSGEVELPGGIYFVNDTNGLFPGDQPGSLSRDQYCRGLPRDPASISAPWGRRECCREQYDVYFEILPSVDTELIAVRSLLPLEQDGFALWQYSDVGPVCGDGMRQCGEQCDPGLDDTETNSDSDDGCTQDCLLRLCGQPVSVGQSDGPTATDALFVLRAAVGLQECGLCACNAHDSGFGSLDINVTDALTVLRSSVDDSVELACNVDAGLRCDGPDVWNPHVTNWWQEGLNRDGVCDDAIGYAEDGTSEDLACIELTACALCGDVNGSSTLAECEEE